MQKKIDTTYLDQLRGVIHSSKGGWIVGEGVHNHGYSMMEDFVGHVSYMQVTVLNATGRLPDKNFTAMLEAIFIGASWPDSRIWCNQIGAFGGTMRTSPSAATLAGALAADSRAYGTYPLVEGVSFIQMALREKQRNLSIGDIIAKEHKLHPSQGYIMGYSRPVAKGDARIPALERTRKKLGLPKGDHLKLAFKIAKYIHKNTGEYINASGYVSALLSDNGFSALEAGRIITTIVSSGVMACYVDTQSRPAQSFLPLRCSDIKYTGKPPRVLPNST
ncbi:MAG: hypothetical protein HQL71_13230 [Magnetococcales bacterium]|nr:hypothetical protein [Magnetococcales bacterium]